jgi:hypothetical protein
MERDSFLFRLGKGMLEEAGAEPEAQCSGSSAPLILWILRGWVNESRRGLVGLLEA